MCHLVGSGYSRDRSRAEAGRPIRRLLHLLAWEVQAWPGEMVVREEKKDLAQGKRERQNC